MYIFYGAVRSSQRHTHHTHTSHNTPDARILCTVPLASGPAWPLTPTPTSNFLMTGSQLLLNTPGSVSLRSPSREDLFGTRTLHLGLPVLRRLRLICLHFGLPTTILLGCFSDPPPDLCWVSAQPLNDTSPLQVVTQTSCHHYSPLQATPPLRTSSTPLKHSSFTITSHHSRTHNTHTPRATRNIGRTSVSISMHYFHTLKHTNNKHSRIQCNISSPAATPFTTSGLTTSLNTGRSTQHIYSKNFQATKNNTTEMF